MPETRVGDPRPTIDGVGFYGYAGAEWIGADGRRYRTNGVGCGLYVLDDGWWLIPGMASFALGPAIAAWPDEIREACDWRDVAYVGAIGEVADADR